MAKRSEKEAALAFRVPRDLHERLAEVATIGDQSLSQEIRQRLEASFRPDPPGDDYATRRLTQAIATVARALGANFANWHEHPVAYTIFKEAVGRLVASAAPSAQNPPPIKADSSLYDANMSPEAAGKIMAGFITFIQGEDKP